MTIKHDIEIYFISLLTEAKNIIIKHRKIEQKNSNDLEAIQNNNICRYRRQPNL